VHIALFLNVLFLIWLSSTQFNFTKIRLNNEPSKHFHVFSHSEIFLSGFLRFLQIRKKIAVQYQIKQLQSSIFHTKEKNAARLILSAALSDGDSDGDGA